MPSVFELVSAIHRKIPTFIEIIAFVTGIELFARLARCCGTREAALGRRMRARCEEAGRLFECGSGGGTDGGGKLTGLVWQFVGIAAVRQIPGDRVT